MKQGSALLVVSVVACLEGGCATPDDPNQAEQYSKEGAYITGSRIPVHDTSGTAAPVGQISKEDWERQNRGQPGTRNP